MLCKNCGAEYEGGLFCANCGTKNEPEATVSEETVVAFTPETTGDTVLPETTVESKLKGAFSSGLFLTICILLSVMTLTTDAFLLPLLCMIGAWIVFAKAKKDNLDGIFKGIKLIRGTVLAETIIYWVCVGLFVLCGVLFAVATPLISGMLPELLGELSMETGIDASAFGAVEALGGAFGIVLCVVFIVLAGVLVAYNLIFLLPLHRSMKTIAAPLDKIETYNFKYIRKCLLVFGILSAVGALGGSETSVSNFSSIYSFATAATMILSSVWVKKNLEK